MKKLFILFKFSLIIFLFFSVCKSSESYYVKDIFVESEVNQNPKNRHLEQTNTDNIFIEYDVETKQETILYESDFNFKECNPNSFSPNQQNILSKNEFLRSDIYASKYSSLPYSAICTMYTTFDTDFDGIGDTTFIGSASIVGPDVVLTAEENTYNSDYGYPTAVCFAPGEHKDQNGNRIKPFGIEYWRSVTRGNYHSTFNADDNWAIIRLNNEIGYETGWLSVSNSGISNGTGIYTVGYGNLADFQVIDYYGIVSNLETYKFNHNDLPTSMSNGAPIMNTSKNTIFGIQSGKRVVINSITYSQACKVSIYIKNWVQERGGRIEVSIFSTSDNQNSSGFASGHSWLVINNKSPLPLYVGNMCISNNESVSLGTWGNKSHIGLYYNLEHYFYINNNSYSTNYSYSKNMFPSEWNNINYIILDNDEWSIIDNCSSFAIDVWNEAFPQFSFNKPSIPTPTNLKNQIISLSGYLSNTTVDGNSNVGYYNNGLFINSHS